MSGLLTRNWYNYVTANLCGANMLSYKDWYGSTHTCGGTIKQYMSSTGGATATTLAFFREFEIKGDMSSPHSASNMYSTAYQGGTVVFGTDDTPPTLDDYRLNGVVSAITTSIVNTTSPTYDSSNHCYIFSRKCTVSNTSSSDVTIKEFGIFAGLCASGDLYMSVTRALIYREVLDTPFTIPAKDTVNFTLTCRVFVPVF